MQCVDFFICNWLKRYRQNTTEKATAKKIDDYYSKFKKQKTPKNPWNSTNSRKKNKVYNVAPQIFVYENGDIYECVALNEIVEYSAWIFSYAIGWRYIGKILQKIGRSEVPQMSRIREIHEKTSFKKFPQILV